MTFVLSEVKSEEEFKAVGVLMQKAYQTPFNSFWEILKGENEPECTSRYWAWHSTPGSHWLQVKDTDTGEVVGACEWIIHESNPFEKGNPIPTGNWWSNGNMRDITNQALYTFFSRRPVTMTKPHALINICCVAQEHRRRGAGRLLMQWGCEVADNKDLEGFVESTEDGVKLYESAGFNKVEKFQIEPSLPEGFSGPEAVEWKQIKEQSFPTPYPVWLMHRPNKSAL